ncbi:aspartate/glutamate racemase family protein [Flavicella sediminum]|uniref:aspartate/glutamate racemase family protein n=1 Tax=Flavicella sediminum TaxID=2585141 RepID=UPI001121D3FF|nr:aspartate/glutamate racemase family protein [Flavicella sediminum]
MNSIRLGILGLGSQTTTFYISELNRMYHKKHGGYSTCPFVLWNSNFHAINSRLPTISKELNTLVQQEILQLENLGSTHLVIPNITLHESIDQLELSKKVLHPVYLTVEKLKANTISKVVLLGSEHTMNSAYIRSIFKENAIEVTIPTATDRQQIDAFRQQVYAQKETAESIYNYHQIIQKYSATNPVVLACTELSIFKPKENKQLVDMVTVQIRAAIHQL